MSQQNVVSVFDQAMQGYGRPFFTPALAAAHRSFADEVNKDDGNPLAAHPEDYELYHLADFDERTGKFTNIDPPLRIARGKDLVTK